MKPRNYKTLGGISFLIGVVLVVNAFSGITGFVVAEGIGKGTSGILGLVFVVGGVLLFILENPLEESVKEAVRLGVPLNEAEKIAKEIAHKISSGEWVELRSFRSTETDNHDKYPHGTSLARYWGPSEYVNNSISSLHRLFRRGKDVGKTHEVSRGSKDYPTKFQKIKKKISIPFFPHVLHRDWKIDQMYDYQTNPRRR